MRSQFKHIFFIFLGCVLGGGITFYTIKNLPLNTYQEGRVSIGVVDDYYLKEKLPLVKDIYKQLEEKRENYQKEISLLEQDLKTENEKLIANKEKLNPQDFAKRRQLFEAKIHELEKKVERRKGQLEVAYTTAHERIDQEIKEILKTLSKEYNIVLFVPKSLSLYSLEQIDLTKEVESRLMKRLPSYKVDIIEPLISEKAK